MRLGAGPIPDHMRTPVDHPRRTGVAAYDSYAEAQRAVDFLSDSGFPVEKVSIVGTGVRYVEQVVGRLTTGRAALLGAAQGATLGGLFGLVWSLLWTIRPDTALILLVLYGIVAGAILGAVLGAVMHAAQGGARDFASAAGMQAERFELQVDEDAADRAAELLRSMDRAPAA
ncbi:MAG: hypothetical protein QOF17_634 [Solirubrobacteraceae bacterium]|nr:hypothetical protein [Solirubrobacteraceae bacterium]